MSNNPEIKLLTEQYKNDFLKFDIDKGIYKKISNRNPRLFSNIIFTKPSLSIEYFDICYEMGIDIIRFIGEDKVFEIIESFEFPNKEFYYKINNIISKDEELSNGLATLKEMNKVIINNEPYENQFLLCLISVLGVIITMLIFCPIIAIFLMIWEIFPNILQFIGNILVDTYVYIFGVFFDGVVLFCGLPFL